VVKPGVLPDVATRDSRTRVPARTAFPSPVPLASCPHPSLAPPLQSAHCDEHCLTVLAEGGGASHRHDEVLVSPGQRLPSPGLFSWGSGSGSARHVLHARARMQRPLAPLPLGVMVGAGKEQTGCIPRTGSRRLPCGKWREWGGGEWGGRECVNACMCSPRCEPRVCFVGARARVRACVCMCCLRIWVYCMCVLRAGLEAAAQLGMSYVKRMFRSGSHEAGLVRTPSGLSPPATTRAGAGGARAGASDGDATFRAGAGAAGPEGHSARCVCAIAFFTVRTFSGRGGLVGW
jgi:hypothetical protein